MSSPIQSIVDVLNQDHCENEIIDGELALIHIAALNHEHELIKILAGRKADFNIKSSAGGSAGFYAIEDGGIETLELLIQLGFDPKTDHTLLFHALFPRLRRDISDLLLKYIDVNTPCYKGRTAMHMAAACDDIRTVDYLLENKANINSLDDNGQTPLTYIQMKEGRTPFVPRNAMCPRPKARNYEKMKQYLIDHGATKEVTYPIHKLCDLVYKL